jgi:hypothetical protein
MEHDGFRWSLKPEGGQWRWQAVGREDGRVAAEGLARTRAEGAAFLARAMSLAIITQEGRFAA